MDDNYGTIRIGPAILSAGAPAPRSNYFMRHWHGQVAPGWSVLAAIGATIFPAPFLTSFVIGFAVSFFASMNGARADMATIALLSLPCLIVLCGWALVGAFRSGWRNRRSAAGIAALIATAFLTLVAVGQIGGLYAQSQTHVQPQIQRHR